MMSDASARPVRIGGLGVTADIMVVASFVVTAFGALAFWQARNALPVDEIYQQYVKGEVAQDTGKINAEIALKARGASDAQLRDMAGGLVKGGAPRAMIGLVSYLIKQEDADGRRLSVFIAEQGGLRWRDPSLLYRAGIEYRIGRYVERDYVKARRYLESPALKLSRGAQHQLGELFLAKDNPARDPAKGLELIRGLAEAGYAPAIKRLEKLGG